LLWQARRGMEIGRVRCTCPGRYHWLYGAMRASGVVASLKSEESRLASLLAPLLRDGSRIMIGGSADPGLFCAVGRVASAGADITVVDRCGAPLELIREFAQAKGLRCRTLNSDLLTLDGRDQWDLILLHYTLNFVAPALRRRFFGALAPSLTPGGFLVCAAMTGESISYHQQSDLAAAFAVQSRQALARTPLADEARSGEFEKSLQIYAADTTAMRLIWPAAEELRDLLRGAGLQVRGEHTMSRDWSLFGVSDAGRRLDSSSIIVAARG
jgi:hypothetical protein